MSKRRRRRRRGGHSLPPSGREQVGEVKREKVNLAETYSYVAADLRRIALIAAVMLVGLVVLSFVLR